MVPAALLTVTISQQVTQEKEGLTWILYMCCPNWLVMTLEFLSRLLVLLHPSVWKEQTHMLVNKRTNRTFVVNSRLSHDTYMCLAYV